MSSFLGIKWETLPEVQVALPGREYAWGDVIEGTARLTGGSAEQVLSEVRVSVMYRSTETYSGAAAPRTEHTDHHFEEAIIVRSLSLPAGSAQDIPFQVRVPDRAASFGDWSVAVRLVQGADEIRQGFARFEVVPPLAVRGLESVLTRALGFEEIYTSCDAGKVEIEFAPPDDLKKHLDGVKLIVRREGEEIVGDLEINPQEKTLADHLKALRLKDRVRHPIRFSAVTLEKGGDDGTPPEEITRDLRVLLESYLK